MWFNKCILLLVVSFEGFFTCLGFPPSQVSLGCHCATLKVSEVLWRAGDCYWCAGFAAAAIEVILMSLRKNP